MLVHCRTLTCHWSLYLDIYMAFDDRVRDPTALLMSFLRCASGHVVRSLVWLLPVTNKCLPALHAALETARHIAWQRSALDAAQLTDVCCFSVCWTLYQLSGRVLRACLLPSCRQQLNPPACRWTL